MRKGCEVGLGLSSGKFREERNGALGSLERVGG